MDFFSQQDKARKNTGWLVVLFVAAVLSLIFITNLLIGLTVWFMTNDETMQQGLSVIAQTDPDSISRLFSWHTFGLISLGVGGAVFCAITYKWFQLSSGGKAVAEALGGVRIQTNTEDPDQRQVLNVVEEMALASGMPVPPVYLLEHEPGINAFAAGNSPTDAVIGVTKGCITHFKRDELQGVVAHEFSHILNGDMRLNLRLIALLHGIVFIGLVGEILARSGGNRRSDGRVAALGIALVVIGWLGTFFGNLIKAAVSRQREFLADSSAVQFTRNPDGIGNALKLIGGFSAGTEINNQHRSEISHMFFGQAIHKMSSWYATHPSIVDRILRIDSDWDGNYLYRGSETRGRKQQEDTASIEQSKKDRFAEVVVTGAAVSAGIDLEGEPRSLDDIRIEIDSIPEHLYAQAKDPLGAIAICYGLLISKNEQLRVSQLAIVSESGVRGAESLVGKSLQELDALPERFRLPLIELLLPALKSMSNDQYKVFKRTLMKLIRADKQTDLFEWCLFQLVHRYLSGEFEPDNNSRLKYKEIPQLSNEYRIVLSLLAHYGHTDSDDKERAFNRGAGAAGLYNLELLPLEECGLPEFMQAVNQMAAAYPLIKPRMLNGLKKCIEQDDQITVVEREMITSIAAVMNCPLPILKEDS